MFNEWFTEMYKVALLTLQFECYASLNIAHVLAFDTGFLEAYSRLFEEDPDTNTLTDELLAAVKDN